MLNSSLFVFWIFFLVATQVSAKISQSGELVMSADTSEYDSQNLITDLQGNVQIIFKNQHLKAERVRVNQRGKTLDAEGNVVIVTPEANIGASRALIDYESNTGVLYAAYVQSGSVLFTGEIIYKTGDKSYLADGARYTACTNCPETWSFYGQKIRAELGGYAYIKNSTMRIGAVPSFWLPYMVVPLKSERQTGLLTPEFERSGRGGNTFSQSYFWALSRSSDATFNFINYELRGQKALFNYRYLLSENSQGEFNTAYIRDRVFANDDRLKNFRSQNSGGEMMNRWFIKYNHYYELPDNYVHRIQINNASDLQYPKDFPLETGNYGDPAFENRSSISRSEGLNSWFVDSSYYINAMKSDPLASNEDAVHRLPEIQYSRVFDRLGDSQFIYSVDLNYTHFTRSYFGYDDLNRSASLNANTPRQVKSWNGSSPCLATSESLSYWDRNPQCQIFRDGKFDPETDLIRTGQRLDGGVSLSRPSLLGKFDILPRLTYRESQYRFPFGPEELSVRRYIKAELAAKTQFNRIFEWSESENIKHEIEPQITAVTIPWIHQPNHYFFGAQTLASGATFYSSQNSLSDADLDSPMGIQFDYFDRIYERKIITVSLLNKLIRKTWSSGQPSYQQFLTWRLAQSYDINQAESNYQFKQPYSDISSELSLNLNHLVISQQANYYPYQKVVNSSTSIKILNDQNDYLDLRYRLAYPISPGQETRSVDREEKYTLTVKKNIQWLDFLGRFTYDINPPIGKEDRRISSYGYGLQWTLPGDCWVIRIVQGRPTDGDDVIHLSTDFSWGGKKSSGMNEETLSRIPF